MELLKYSTFIVEALFDRPFNEVTEKFIKLEAVKGARLHPVHTNCSHKANFTSVDGLISVTNFPRAKWSSSAHQVERKHIMIHN